MIQIQLEPEVEAQLAAEAQARGMAVAEFVAECLVARLGRPIGVNRPDAKAVAGALGLIQELRKGNRLGDDLTPRDLIDEGRKY